MREEEGGRKEEGRGRGEEGRRGKEEGKRGRGWEGRRTGKEEGRKGGGEKGRREGCGGREGKEEGRRGEVQEGRRAGGEGGGEEEGEMCQTVSLLPMLLRGAERAVVDRCPAYAWSILDGKSLGRAELLARRHLRIDLSQSTHCTRPALSAGPASAVSSSGGSLLAQAHQRSLAGQGWTDGVFIGCPCSWGTSACQLSI